jgi:tetratricopeptide (TPR) repeat protein
MGQPDKAPVTSSGDRSVAAQAISGQVATGDHASLTMDARTIGLAPGSIPDPAQVAVTGQVSNLPRPPAHVFAGRSEAMEQLTGATTGPGAPVITQAIYGLGGVGKSELVLQYAHTRQHDYPLTWWITAASRAQISDGLAALAARLCPPIALAGTTGDAAAWAAAWLQAHGQWLLVLDNLNEPAHATQLLAQLRGGHIIITTRRDTDWAQHGASPVRLDVLDPGSAAAILTQRTGYTSPLDQAAAATIAAELGYLPLALNQAAAYITQTRIALTAYLTKLRADPARVHAAAVPGAQDTIARLWDITLGHLTTHHPHALQLLRILACYAPDNIPRVLAHDPAPGTDADEELAQLASYSLITLTPETITIHRLLQAVLQAHASRDGGPEPRGTALKWMNQAMPAGDQMDPGAWPLLRDLVPHAEALTNLYSPATQPRELARLHNRVAKFHQSQGDYQRALNPRQSALSIAETTLGSGHLTTAVYLGNLAVTYRALGRPGDALPLDQRALAITEAALGPDHPTTALRLGSLAVAYGALGRPGDALPLEQRALAITEAALGPDHRRTALRLGNLATAYSDLGRPGDALPLDQRALAVTEAVLGPGHLDVAIRLGNLAATYRDLGQPSDALPLEQRALAVTEAVLGPDHPRTGLRLGNLAATYRDLRRPGDALPLEQRALAVTEAALGPDHPRTGLRLSNLAATYRALSRPSDAVPLQQRALAITEAALGPDHPDVAIRLGNLAMTYRDLGRPGDALPLQQQALVITEAALGPGHPTTALRLASLAAIYRVLGRPGDALPLQQQALAVTEAALGPDHPRTGLRLGNLAAIYRALGRDGDALPLEERAAVIGKTASG